MAYVPGIGYLPNIDKTNYALRGMERGQAMRKSALDQQAQQQTIDQGALKQERAGEQREVMAHARGAFNVINAKDKQGAYSRYRDDMITKGYETPEEMPEAYSADMDDTFTELYRAGQGFSALGEKSKGFKLGAGQAQYDATGNVIAERAAKKEKVKQLPMNFAKNFNERLAMDIGEDLDELPKEDIKLIRDATSAKMREGIDFEAAYTSTLQELGLQENESFFGFDDFELAPQATPQAVPQSAPAGQSVNQSIAPEAAKRLGEIKKRRMELEAMRQGAGA